MLAAWVEAGTFSTTRLRPGYDMEEVDAFANAIRDTFHCRHGHRAGRGERAHRRIDYSFELLDVLYLLDGPADDISAPGRDCLQGSDLANFSQGNGPFTTVPCTQRHTEEVFFAGNAWPRSLAYPGDQAVYDDGYARCLTAFSAYDGTDSSSSAFGVMSSTPDSSTWPGGDRRLVCFATMLVSVDYSIRGSGQ